MITAHPKWQLQDAQQRFSELIEKASHEGPQTVTKNGIDEVVVLSSKDFDNLMKPKESLIEFFQNSPLKELDFEQERTVDEVESIEY